MVEKWKSRPKKVRGIPTFPPSRRRLRLDYFLTPQTTLQFSTPLLTQTLQSRQGDTMWVGSTIQPRPSLFQSKDEPEGEGKRVAEESSFRDWILEKV